MLAGLPVQTPNGPIMAVVICYINQHWPASETKSVGSIMAIIDANGFHGSRSRVKGYTFLNVQDWQNFISG